MFYRLASEGMGTLSEVMNEWSLDEVMKGNAYLDMRADIEKDQVNSSK